MTLVGYWPLNEDSGDTAYDHSGNENHGNIDGGISLGSNGILGDTAYSFPNTNDNILVSHSSDINLTNQGTISVWFYSEKEIYNNYNGIVSKDNDDGSTNQIQYGLTFSSNNEVRPYISDGTTFDGLFADEDAFPQGEWIHLVFTWDGNKMILYQQGTVETQKKQEVSSAQSTNYDLKIGSAFGASDQYIYGKISEVRIYDRPLTQNEIQYLYNVGKRGLQTTSKKSS